MVKSKHPALVSRNAVSESRNEIVESHPKEWDKIGYRERVWLAHYAWTRDAIAACDKIGVKPHEIEEWEYSNPAFLKMRKWITARPKDFATMALQDMLPASVIKLAGIIDQEENRLAQLNAIKHLHYMTDMMPQEAKNSFAQSLVQVSLSWGNDGSPKVVDAKGTKDDD